MNELLKTLDAEIAAALAAIDPLREKLAVLEAEFAKLQSAKVALLGQVMPRKTRSTKTLGQNPVRGRPSFRPEQVATVLEEGPMMRGEIAKKLRMNASNLNYVIGSHPEWFISDRGMWSLTEAGRNRHKQEAA